MNTFLVFVLFTASLSLVGYILLGSTNGFYNKTLSPLVKDIVAQIDLGDYVVYNGYGELCASIKDGCNTNRCGKILLRNGVSVIYSLTQVSYAWEALTPNQKRKYLGLVLARKVCSAVNRASKKEQAAMRSLNP